MKRMPRKKRPVQALINKSLHESEVPTRAAHTHATMHNSRARKNMYIRWRDVLVAARCAESAVAFDPECTDGRPRL